MNEENQIKKIKRIVGIEASRQRLGKKLTKWGAINITPVIDFATGTAIVSFEYKGNRYSFRYKDKNGTQAMARLSWSINRLVDCDIRKILPFAKTAKEFISLPEPEGFKGNDFKDADIETFAVLGLTNTASNEEISKKFKQLATMFHPDRAINEEDRHVYEKKMAELNQAYTEIKKTRGF